MFVRAGRQLLAIKPFNALAGMFCFEFIITTGGNAWKNSTASVAARMVAECALPTVVMPGHTNSDVLNG